MSLDQSKRIKVFVLKCGPPHSTRQYVPFRWTSDWLQAVWAPPRAAPAWAWFELVMQNALTINAVRARGTGLILACLVMNVSETRLLIGYAEMLIFFATNFCLGQW